MAAETFNTADAQDMSFVQPVEAQESVCQSVNGISNQEQQSIRDQEYRRVVESTQSLLPDLFLSDDLSSAPKSAAGAEPQSGTPNSSSEVDAKDMQKLFEANLPKLDKNQDGFVSKDEIDTAFADPSVTGRDAQFISALRNNRESLQALSNDEFGPENDGITRADMQKFNELANADPTKLSPEETSLVAGVNGSTFSTKMAADQTDRHLFADQSNPLASIKPDAINQGGIGDCYLIAAISSFAAQSPETIKNMLKDNQDGTYSVTFPDSPDKPVTVNAPTDAELGTYAHVGKDGIWPAVLEKAYGKHKDESNIIAQQGIPDGGRLSTGLHALTGKDNDVDFLAFTSQATTDKKLAEAMSEHRPVTAGIAPQFSDGELGLPDKHAYSVLDYNQDKQVLTIRNPWGSTEPTNKDGSAKDGRNDGIFQVTLPEFMSNFSFVAYVEP